MPSLQKFGRLDLRTWVIEVNAKVGSLLPASSTQTGEHRPMNRRRYQYGSLTKRNNMLSEDVWQFRFYETTPEGRRYRRSTSVGTVTQYPTKTDALRIIEPLRLRLNLHHRFGRPVSVDALVGRYVEHELPERRHSTQQSHSSTLNRWIRPRWGDYLLEQVKPVAVEEWLRSLALAPKTKVNLRSLFHLLYESRTAVGVDRSQSHRPGATARRPQMHTARVNSWRDPPPFGAAGRAIPHHGSGRCMSRPSRQ